MRDFSIEYLRRRLAYDALSGVVSRLDGRKKDQPAGFVSNGYVLIEVRDNNRRRVYKAHRLAWLLTFGAWPEGQIDHVNGIRADNRLANLRDVPPAVNTENQRHARVDNRLGILGVRSFSTAAGVPRFTASIQSGKNRFYLGVHDTAEQAHDAYVSAKRRLHAGCTL